MPKDPTIKTVLVIGSGPIVIGQAAEFDYAGTQACRALREEGVRVVLCNSNPATIMTDPDMADRTYIEPITAEVVRRIIEAEKPDAVLPGLGGQTGLNMAMELHDSGYLQKMGVRMLGTPASSIREAEDREEFKDLMVRIGQPVIPSVIVHTLAEALAFAQKEGYPLVIRPAYTLGGAGGGIVHNEAEMRETCSDGLALSRVHQVLVEKCISGWKEIEYEVMRDGSDHAVVICSMENIDPVGVHTGDSIVVAPAMTMDAEEEVLRSAALSIIRALKIEGGCNVQFALHPDTLDYAVIEVNPRVSRSSALASKATGYPIAKVTAKVALGYRLDEIVNRHTGKPFAHLQPVVDYTVLKFPRFPFDKFVAADKALGTRMKATGEVMSIDRDLKPALLKAVRSLELGLCSLLHPAAGRLSDEEVRARLHRQDDERFFMVAEALRRGVRMDEVYDATRITPTFLQAILDIVRMEEDLRRGMKLTRDNLLMLKRTGFSDKAIAQLGGTTEPQVRALRHGMGLRPGYAAISSCGSPYYYGTYHLPPARPRPNDKKVVGVLGAGPIRIGQGIEFDYASVHCIWALQRMGYEAVIINNNPETVSTDFDTADRLYFEPLTPEDALEVLDVERPMGTVVQFGGQTAIKLTKAVSERYPVLGTAPDMIDAAEDKKLFDALLERLCVARPKGDTVFTAEEAAAAADRLGYPVLVRPSYVLGGQGMEIAYDEAGIREYMAIINRDVQDHPILVDKYLRGREVEVDAICDGAEILVPGIMEHIERAGVHSGDSISVYPAASLSQKVVDSILDITRKIALGLQVKGLVNIQYIVAEEKVYVIEANPRSSRTVPYLSKVTGVPMVDLASRCMMGQTLKGMGAGTGICPARAYVAVKVPVFSFERLPDVEPSLGPEMKSTGEVLGLARDGHQALVKGLQAAGLRMPQTGKVLITVAGADKQEMLPIAEAFAALGYDIVATGGTARFLQQNFIAADAVPKLQDPAPNIGTLIGSGEVCLIINTPTHGRKPQRDGFRIRRMAVEKHIPCLTSLDTARELTRALTQREGEIPLLCLQDLEV